MLGDARYTKPDSILDPFFHYFEEFLGSGIFVVKHGVGAEDKGQEWNKMRKLGAKQARKQVFGLKTHVFEGVSWHFATSAAYPRRNRGGPLWRHPNCFESSPASSEESLGPDLQPTLGNRLVSMVFSGDSGVQ